MFNYFFCCMYLFFTTRLRRPSLPLTQRGTHHTWKTAAIKCSCMIIVTGVPLAKPAPLRKIPRMLCSSAQHIYHQGAFFLYKYVTNSVKFFFFFMLVAL